MTTRRVFASLAAIAAVLGTTACGGEAEEPATIAPEAPEGISVSGGWMALPAVTGNPGAAYFTISNQSEQDAMIRAVDLVGASSAVLHETATWNRETDMQELFQVPVPAGGELVFEPGGKHVMVFELDEGLEPGGETEMTLVFVGGDKVSFPVEIRAAGDDGSGEE